MSVNGSQRCCNEGARHDGYCYSVLCGGGLGQQLQCLHLSLVKSQLLLLYLQLLTCEVVQCLHLLLTLSLHSAQVLLLGVQVLLRGGVHLLQRAETSAHRQERLSPPMSG